MRAYGQACGLAKALDVIGDRWSMLIVRELLIRDGCRYTDLLRGLPGVATNLLADRLRKLEASDLIWLEDAPAPVATTLYRLTERGQALESALLALGKWGSALLSAEEGRNILQPHWLVLPLRVLLRDNWPDRPPVSLAIESEGETIGVVANGTVDVRLRRVSDPAATLRGPARAVLRLMSGRVTLHQCPAEGLKITGDSMVLNRLIAKSEIQTEANDGG